MKNILLSLASFTILAACSSKSDLNSNADDMTIRNLPLYNNSVFSDTAKAEVDDQPAKIVQSRRKPVTIKHSSNVATRRAPEPVYIPEPKADSRVVTAPVATIPAPAPVSTADNTASSGGTGSSNGTETASTIPQTEKKKGWSKAAKGTVIGAGAGAIGGAIISKKKGLGAIVGGVVGAAGGYIIGKGMDKKDNRFTTD